MRQSLVRDSAQAALGKERLHDEETIQAARTLRDRSDHLPTQQAPISCCEGPSRLLARPAVAFSGLRPAAPEK